MGAKFLWLALLSLAAFSGCERYDNFAAYRDVSLVTNGGNPQEGKNAIAYYGCGTCHTIPGVRDAVAVVGPPLEHIANRNVIAGKLPNTPENLMKWIEKPREISPHTLMPNMNVSDQDARNIAAYLYTLK
jgi:cytochrome c2